MPSPTDLDSSQVASMASTGFGLTVVSNAAKRGVMERGDAEMYVLRALRFAREHVHRRAGWFLHFVDWRTGARAWGSEYSTIDTALFIAGALYAAQVFPDNAEIGSLAGELYQDLDFTDVLTDGGLKPDKRTLSMAYFDESGYTPAQWDMYAEQKILLILGLGHPSHPLPADAWLAFGRDTSRLPGGDLVMGEGGALFLHQYSELYLDFRRFNDGFPNYFENGRRMTSYQRDLAVAGSPFETLRQGFWGFSAGDSPIGYRVWSALYHQGTVCIGCVGGSAMFMPSEVLRDLAGWKDGAYGARLWGRYGFVDSLDLDQSWFSPVVLGITKGPEYISVANTDPATSIWQDFMRIPAIERGMARAASALKQSHESVGPLAQD
jgi:hypothetical protein